MLASDPTGLAPRAARDERRGAAFQRQAGSLNQQSARAGFLDLVGEVLGVSMDDPAGAALGPPAARNLQPLRHGRTSLNAPLGKLRDLRR